ncbi:histidine kinase [Acanthopleuribacter pedis]|uniref:Histidine kinase n=1 Tax=Acanthopleuribacter pedis TaxID=442870 RepID=A0A8J7U5J4_9BACT|nr:sensor histidine kinase [Acanthopleuribacter pedis]MBO1319386.1 histidine kinase [Acanthopleuribacter pedis]
MSFFCLMLFTSGLAVPAVYEGQPLELSRQPWFTLYRGVAMEPVAGGLDTGAAARQIAGRSDLWWLETEVAVPKALRDAQDIQLFIKSDVAAFEVLFNDRVVLQNGTVAENGEGERAGRYIVSRQVPRHWIRTGDAGRDRNTLVIRFSNVQFPQGCHFFDISLGPNGLAEAKTGPWVYGPLVLCGVFLLAVCLNLAFLVAFKGRLSFLLLAGLFAVCFWAMAEDVWLYRFPAGVAFRHLGVMGGRLDDAAFLLLNLAVAWTFRDLFRTPARPLWGCLVAGAATAFLVIGDHPLYYFFMSWPPLLFALGAGYRGLKNGRLLSAALLVFAALVYGDEANLLDGVARHNFVVTSLFYYLDYVGFALMAFVMVIVSAAGIIQQNRDLDQAQLRTSRLELELLGKHLHPHFLMNTLTALQHLLMTDRTQAVSLLDALAEELHLLREMSRRRMVTLDEECAICRTHLKIMNMQQRADFRWCVENVDGSATLPPAVLHTLVENGLTHGYAGRTEGVFRLTGERADGVVRYRLFNDSRVTGGDGVPAAGSGTGLAYVRACLEEAYPGRWRFHAGPVPGGWEAVVEVPA